MTLDKILNISGKPGLYKLISHAKGHLVVESLEDGKRFPVVGNNQVGSLDNIAVYTYTEELPLKKVLHKIFEKENGKSAISHQEKNEELLHYFSEILPDFDRERVYPSHIKKIVLWYNLLVKTNFDFTLLVEKTVDESED